MALSESQYHRYARHILLPEVGEAGQEKLTRSSVLVIGAGGLGSPVLLYLAAAGVGTLGIVDDDTVDLSNLQRQIVHTTASVGEPKVDSAVPTLKALNSEVRVNPHRVRLTADNALDLVSRYDIVVDGSDNFETRFLVNDACYFAKSTLVSAAILRFDGQISTFKAHLGGDNPCYRCLYREAPAQPMVRDCAEAGVIGAMAGTVGAIQATETVKELLGIGDSLSGQLLLYDALGATFRKVRVRPDPDCPLCGERPTITSLAREPETAGACPSRG